MGKRWPKTVLPMPLPPECGYHTWTGSPADGWCGVSRHWTIEDARKEAARMHSYAEHAVVIRRLSDNAVIYANDKAKMLGIIPEGD